MTLVDCNNPGGAKCALPIESMDLAELATFSAVKLPDIVVWGLVTLGFILLGVLFIYIYRRLK